MPSFETFIIAAKECAEVEVVARSDWFASNETELLLQIDLHTFKWIRADFNHAPKKT